MSTFAVFGMTRDYARQAALKNTSTVMFEPGSNVLGSGGRREMKESEWLEAVDAQADRLFKSKRLVQLSGMFDAPQFAADFIKLVREQCESRDLIIKYRHKVKKEGKAKKPYSLEWRSWDG